MLCVTMVLVSLVKVSMQCNEQVKTCPNGLCSDECETSSASASGVEAIVAIMSVSVVLILGLVILLVYICLKQGPWTHGDSNDSNENTCESTTVDIPEYLTRRRFSSLSMSSGPPPYFSLFRLFLNENGELRSTGIAGENVKTENTRLPSVEQPPEYGVLFGQSPPPYEHVVRSESLQTEAATNARTDSGC